jgi:very-short-patch-repair endonuclease
MAAEYLAFYQTAAFPEEERWQIRWMAPVRGYFVTSRRELLPEEPDHPRAADLYYKVTLGPMIALRRAIPSRRLRRIAFIATTLVRLCDGAEINDLWIRTSAQERLWTALRQAELESECFYPITEGDSGYDIDFALPCRDGKVAVMIEDETGAAQRLGETVAVAPTYLLSALGWTPIQLLAEDVQRDATSGVSQIAALCTRLGGTT